MPHALLHDLVLLLEQMQAEAQGDDPTLNHLQADDLMRELATLLAQRLDDDHERDLAQAIIAGYVTVLGRAAGHAP